MKSRRYRAIIADDERIVLDGLLNFIDWTALGIDIIAAADNGLDVLDLVSERHPDILITDIVMPRMDGMELISTLRSRGYGNLKIVLLSGHNEFQFAQNAISAGASAYLLKPCSPQKLIDTARRMVRELDAENRLHHMLIESKPYLISSFFVDVFQGLIQEESEFQHLLELFGLRQNRKRQVVLLVHATACESKGSGNLGQSISRLHYSQYSVIGKLLHGSRSGYALTYHQFGVVVILHIPDDDERRDPNGYIADFVTDVRDAIREFMNVHTAIAVGTVEDNSLSGVRRSFQNGLSAMNHRISFGADATIHYEDLSTLPQKRPPHPSIELQTLSRALINRDVTALKKTLSDIFPEEGGTIFSDEHLNDLCRIVLLTVSLTLAEIGESIRDLWTEEGEEDPWNLDFSELADLQSVRDWFGRFFVAILAKIDSLANARNRRLCDQIRQIVSDNCSEIVRLEQLSEHFHLTPNYISSIFKETVGKSYKDYITTVKIDKAKELIKTSRYTNTEIALMVGYRNYEHFRKKFKAVTGLNPSECY